MDSWFAASNDDFGMPAWKPVIKIDYLFAYPQKGWRVISTQTVQSLLSDHLPIITELEYVKEASKKKSVVEISKYLIIVCIIENHKCYK